MNRAHKRTYLPITIKHIRPTPLDYWAFIQPLMLAAHPCVILPACAYAMVFLFGSILPSIEIPRIWPEKFGSNTQQVGFQFISQIVGSVIGEQVGGHLSDRWMWHRQRRRSQPPVTEYRLWISYVGLALTICGVVVFLVQTENASSHWNITPLIGVAIAAAGNQVITTVYMTYAVDCNTSEAASVGVLITFVRQIWGFIGPFWYVLPFPFALAVITVMKVPGNVGKCRVFRQRGHLFRADCWCCCDSNSYAASMGA